MELAKASIVITTRNRRDEALRAVKSSLAQDYPNFEVLVFDDASEDGTAERLQKEFPQVRIFAEGERKGLIFGRNRGFEEARGGVVFSIDDDAYFSQADIVSRTMSLFDQNSDVAAVAIPYIEPLDQRSLSSLRAPYTGQPGQELRSYVGCAHAIRREVARAMGGYREFFVHQGEERDLCLRIRDAGWRVIYGDSGHIVHTVSPKRDSNRVMYYGLQNIILYSVLNIPFPHLLVRLIWDPIASLHYRFSFGTLPVKLRGIAAGIREGIIRLPERRAVSRKTYAEFRRLPGHGPEAWDGPIPGPCTRNVCDNNDARSNAPKHL